MFNAPSFGPESGDGFSCKNGAPGEIRTHDLCLRRAALYPAELRVLAGWGYSLEVPDASRFPPGRWPFAKCRAVLRGKLPT